ncbi:hypothetical protein LTR08_005236 [Meristemomyces frigidus]|nr:hypothetical protein LTR08_005236 [Meristemomyces frigidus]
MPVPKGMEDDAPVPRENELNELNELDPVPRGAEVELTPVPKGTEDELTPVPRGAEVEPTAVPLVSDKKELVLLPAVPKETDVVMPVPIGIEDDLIGTTAERVEDELEPVLKAMEVEIPKPVPDRVDTDELALEE